MLNASSRILSRVRTLVRFCGASAGQRCRDPNWLVRTHKFRALRPHVGPANSCERPLSVSCKSLTILRGRNAELPLECAIERGLGFVTDVGRDPENRVLGRLKLSRRELQPPSHQIGQWRFAKKPRESLRHNSARTARLGCQLCHSPRMGWLAV
jgi:hypothetical protein